MSRFCADASRVADEPLAGTAAAEVSLWIALEYPRRWDAKAPKVNDLPDAVDAKLRAWKTSHAGARLQFIQRPGRDPDGPRALYIADAAGGRLFRLDLERVEALIDVDLERLLERGSAPGATVISQPVVLVCNHGKRDLCCAKWGTKVYKALQRHAPERVWQTTHLGGHRFAATLVTLPHGYCYGRVEAKEVAGLIDAHDRGELWRLEQLRGRCLYPAPAQAAEVALRAREQRMGVDDLRLTGLDEVEANARWRARFALDAVETSLEIHREVRADATRITSCGDGEASPISTLVVD